MGGGPGKPFSFEKSITFIILVISICEPALVYSKTKELGFCRNVRRGTGAVENYSFKEINAIIAPLASISLRIQTREFLTGNPRQEFVEMVEMNNEVIRELQEYLVRRGFKINIWEYSNYEWIFGEQNISEGLKVRSLYFDLSDPRVRELRGSKLFHRLLGSEVIDSGIEYSPIMGAIELWEAQAHPKLVRLDHSKGRVLLADQLESGLRHEGSHTALRLRRAKGKANGIFDLEFSDADGKLVDVNVYKKKFHGEEVYAFSRTILDEARDLKQGGRFFEAKEEIRESAAILYSLARSSRRMSLKARDALFKGFPVWGAPPSKDGTVKLPHGITFYSNGVAVEILGKNSEEVFFRTVNEADQKAIDELFGPESENSLKRNQAARHLTTKFYDLLNESNQINLKVERLTVKIENLFNEAKLEPSIANYVQKGITHDEKGQPTLATQFFDTIDELNLLVRQELYPQLRTQAGDVK